MAHDELDELLAMLARERAVIDHYTLEAHRDTSADDVSEDYTATVVQAAWLVVRRCAELCQRDGAGSRPHASTT